MPLKGVMYTGDIQLQRIFESYQHRFGCSPAWIVGTAEMAHAVSADDRLWLAGRDVTLAAHPEAKGYWWAGTGALP